MDCPNSTRPSPHPDRGLWLLPSHQTVIRRVYGDVPTTTTIDICWRLRDYLAQRGVFFCKQRDVVILNSAIACLNPGTPSTVSAIPLSEISGFPIRDRIPQHTVHAQEIPELNITLTKDTPLRLTKDVTVSTPGRSIENYYKGTRLLFSGFAEDQLQGFVIDNGQVGEEVKVTRTMLYCANHRHPCQAYLRYQYPGFVAYASMTTWEGTEDLLVSVNMPINPTRLVPSPKRVMQVPPPPKKNQY
ncbi:hypothetical protein PTTG_11460 [Puccinia triticina 1-1 BBBD Race 1]|uniref:Uncharacterized protein n=1 Tax=Puccinia triticina (isolate 1-1 / race 1 (BBBD)) TaxID=630390 RepID=A0A180G0P6_PUCT1|nr:hypothetical protein PTTG_11460 [Puccinia triticina 1-1 BBBD Race 1]